MYIIEILFHSGYQFHDQLIMLGSGEILLWCMMSYLD